MAFTIPSLSEVLNSTFTRTWYEIRAKAIDNVINAIPVWAALREMGSQVFQAGGRLITRTIRHSLPGTQNVAKGDILPSGEVDTRTMARWTPRYVATHVQKSIFDDAENSGPFQIVPYVQDRLFEAREALIERNEDALLTDSSITDESGKGMQSIWEAIPPFASRTTGTYGGISRTSANTFWIANYKAFTLPIAVNLVEDMNNLFNTCTKHQEAPDLIVTDQTKFEVYQNFALDASQIIKDAGTFLADLGFEVIRFRGKPMVWTTNSSFTGNLMMLNSKYLEIVVNPNMWFMMTPFKNVALQGESIAHIVSSVNLIGTQPRRQGLMYTA